MIDIDHFKSFNDRYGHAVGDQVIQRVAKTLASGVRAGDLLCRYGGEEFCIILPVAFDRACEIVERIRHKIETECGAGMTPAGLQITASFGVSSLALAPASLSELINQADQALYAAKRAGRNRVCRFDDIEDPADPARSLKLKLAEKRLQRTSAG